MSTINQLSAVDQLSVSDLLPVFSTQNGDARKASLAVLAAFIQSQLKEPNGLQTQYFAPNATGFAVTVAPAEDGESVFLLMTPTADFAAGTITLPPLASCADGQEVLVSSTHAVTTLTVAGNGATAVNGAPSTLTANGFFRLRYDGIAQSWYRIG